jgi:hypothetical protein
MVCLTDFKEFGPTTFHINNEGWFADAGVRGALPVSRTGNWELIGNFLAPTSRGTAVQHDRHGLYARAVGWSSGDLFFQAVAFNPFGDRQRTAGGFAFMPTIESGFRAVTLHRGASRFNARGETRTASWPARCALRPVPSTAERKLDGRGVADRHTAPCSSTNSSAQRDRCLQAKNLCAITGTDFHSDFGKLALSVAGRYERYSELPANHESQVGFVLATTHRA